MRGLTGIFVLLAALAAPTAGRSQDEPVPQSVWKDAQAEATHLQSGLRCPPSLGEFKRVSVITFDGYGLDVGCGYNAPGAIVTLYLTRRADLEPAFAEAEDALAKSPMLRNPRALSAGSVQQGGLTWRRAQYTEDEGKRSDIWLTKLDGWLLKYRVTYLPQAEASVARGLEQLTELARASAGAQLATCAKSSEPRRTGKLERSRGKGSEDAGVASALLGAAAAAASREAPAVITYCVEEPVEGTKSPMLAWRGVLAGGVDAKVDRLTAMTVGPPPTLDLAQDGLASLVRGQGGPDLDTPTWVASLRRDGQVLIFANYQGRPAARTVAPLFQDVLDGKAEPIGSYSADGKTVSIGAPPAR